MSLMAHQIALDPTPREAAYFRRACGTERYAYNWGLDEWERMRARGEKPTMKKVKAAWNAHRAAELPWTYEVTKCASADAIINLGTAFANFFRDLKKPKNERHFRYPQRKHKRLDMSFALWIDQFDNQAPAFVRQFRTSQVPPRLHAAEPSAASDAARTCRCPRMSPGPSTPRAGGSPGAIPRSIRSTDCPAHHRRHTRPMRRARRNPPAT